MYLKKLYLKNYATKFFIYKNQRFSNIKKKLCINDILLFIDSNFELN